MQFLELTNDSEIKLDLVNAMNIGRVDDVDASVFPPRLGNDKRAVVVFIVNLQPER
jgi:hypothetical protein